MVAHQPSPERWRGRRVLITGHTGFKGSWLSLWLHSMQADIAGFALAPNTLPNLYAKLEPELSIRSNIADVTDAAQLLEAIEKFKPEVVFHLAAQPLVRLSYREPATTYATNVMGTVNMLDSVRRLGRPCAVVVITTDKVYENKEWHWGYREVDRLGGHDPYSNSKACTELVTQSFRDSFFSPAQLSEHGVAIASARAGNVIGGGDWAEDRLLPDLLRAVAAGRAPVLRNPHATRPWQHVLEPLAGYLLLAEALLDGDQQACAGWNFGPRDSDVLEVGEVAEMLCRGYGLPAAQYDDQPQPHEAGLLKLDSSKARTQLGWQPRWDVATAIDEIIQWHRGFDAGRPAIELCRETLQRYVESHR